MNKRGEFLPLWNWDLEMGHGPQTGRMYTAILISTTTGKATGLLVDHTGNIDMDLGHGHLSETQVTVKGDSLTLYFFMRVRTARLSSSAISFYRISTTCSIAPQIQSSNTF